MAVVQDRFLTLEEIEPADLQRWESFVSAIFLPRL
jgi:hypothetical protein